MQTVQTLPLKELRCLVVDDHMMMRNFITQNLKALGMDNVDSVPNGSQALAEIKASEENENPYHVIFLDWHMPEMDGLEVLKRCRENKIFDKMAIVMLTAEQEEKNILKALESGATSYLVKPVSRESFEDNLEKILKWLDKNNPELSSH